MAKHKKVSKAKIKSLPKEKVKTVRQNHSIMHGYGGNLKNDVYVFILLPPR